MVAEFNEALAQMRKKDGSLEQICPKIDNFYNCSRSPTTAAQQLDIVSNFAMQIELFLYPLIFQFGVNTPVIWTVAKTKVW